MHQPIPSERTDLLGALDALARRVGSDTSGGSRTVATVAKAPKGTRTRQMPSSQRLTSSAKESIVTKRVPFGELLGPVLSSAIPLILGSAGREALPHG